MLSFCHDIGLKSCWDFFLPFFCFVTPTCKALVSHWTILLFVHRLEIHYGPPDLPLQACVTWWHCRRQVLSCHSFREERVLRVPGTHHWRFPTFKFYAILHLYSQNQTPHLIWIAFSRFSHANYHFGWLYRQVRDLGYRRPRSCSFLNRVFCYSCWFHVLQAAWLFSKSISAC